MKTKVNVEAAWNFIETLDISIPFDCNVLNLRQDAKLYNWNEDTVRYIYHRIWEKYLSTPKGWTMIEA